MGTRAAADESFLRFWAVYPKHVGRLDALKAWKKLDPAPELVERILAALVWQVKQASWLKDDGQFIPYPASWIRGGRYDDEPVRNARTTTKPKYYVRYADRKGDE